MFLSCLNLFYSPCVELLFVCSLGCRCCYFLVEVEMSWSSLQGGDVIICSLRWWCYLLFGVKILLFCSGEQMLLFWSLEWRCCYFALWVEMPCAFFAYGNVYKVGRLEGNPFYSKLNVSWKDHLFKNHNLCFWILIFCHWIIHSNDGLSCSICCHLSFFAEL